MSIDPGLLPYRSCVELFILNREGQVWVGRRVGASGQDGLGNWWQMPQGGIDQGEEPAIAAMRELNEETGIHRARIIAESHTWYPYDLPPNLIGRVWGGRFRGQMQKWFALAFEGEDSEIDINPRSHSPEFDRWRWASVEDLPQLVVPFKRDVYDKVLDEFRSLALDIQRAGR